jgi:L-ascorbate metabolism protein UlaG (beta-lactamase superfamily)
MRLALLGALALVAMPQQVALQATFIGNMAVSISDGAVTLVSDFPYRSGYSGYMTYPQSDIRSATAVTLALITHRHPDHWEPSLFAKTGWKVAGPADVVSHVSADRVVVLDGPTTFGPIRVEPVATPHAGIGHFSYVVTWHGRRLYFTGDTESIDALVAARNLDVAFVSPWNHHAVVRSGRRIDTKQIVIYHHQAGEQVADCRDRCTVPAQGHALSIP